MSDRAVVLLAGPPCAGKSTLVQRWVRPGDVVADFDAVAAALGSAGKWRHTTAIGDAAERRMAELVAQVAAMESGRAWIVRCVPDPDDRAELAAGVRADRVLVLCPPLATLLTRARQRPLPDETVRSIWRWRDRYQPGPGDELVTPATMVSLLAEFASS